MAGSSLIGRLAVSLALETAAFEKGIGLAEKRFEQSRKRFEKLGQSMSSIGTKLSIGLTAPLAALGVASYKAAQESADALGQVTSALASMGDASGRTVAQLQALAASQMGQSLYDDDEILRKVTANLLTFGKVSGTVFDQAQQAAIDLSARLGTDLQSSAVMIGKALNDPLKGLTALSRVGVSFTEQQKEQVKAMVAAGNAAGAQALILGELQKQYGGAAAAARAADPTAESKQAWAEFQETIGALVVKVLPPLTDFLTKVLNAFNDLSPGMQKVVVIGAAVAAALGPVLTVVGGLVSVGAPFLSFLKMVAPAFGLLSKAVLLLALNPAFLGLAAVVAGIYFAWKNWDKITEIAKRLYTGVKTWISDKLGAVLDGLKAKVKAVGDWFYNLYDRVVGNSYVPDMVDGIAAQMARLDAAMVDPAAKAARKTGEAFREMAGQVQGILDRLFPSIAAARKFAEEAATLKAGIKDPVALGNALRALGREEAGLPTESRSGAPLSFDPAEAAKPLTGMSEAVEKLMERLAGLKARAGETTVRVAKSFKDMADETLGAISRVADAIRGGGFLGILEAVIGLGLQLGSIGAFGSKIASRINASGIPGRAMGGPVIGGRPYLVGERGPELVVPRHSGTVVPNHALRSGPQLVEIVDTTGLFRFRVDGQIRAAAPGIAGAGAQLAGQQQMFQRSRRLA